MCSVKALMNLSLNKIIPCKGEFSKLDHRNQSILKISF